MTFEQVLQVIGTLKWPATVTVLFIIFILALRKDLGAWIRTWRGWKVWKAKVSAEGPQEQAAAAPALPLPPAPAAAGNGLAPAVVPPAQAVPLTATGDEMRALIVNAIGQYQGDERLEILERISAAALATTVFERANSHLWGSQIKVLQELNAMARPREFFVPLFEETQARHPSLQDDTYDRWLEFPSQYGLVDFRDGQVVITHTGQDFLRYLIDQGYRSERPL